MTKTDFIEMLRQSEREPRLGAVIDNALALIVDSATFRIDSHTPPLEYNGDPAHLFSTFSHRLEMQRKKGRVDEGIEETVQTFANASGPLGISIAEIKEAVVCVWFDRTQKIVGFILTHLPKNSGLNI